MLFTLLACTGSEPSADVQPVTSEELTAQAPVVLCEAAAQVAMDCAVEGARARVAGSELEFAVTVNSSTALPGRSIGMGASAQQLPGEVLVSGVVRLSLDGASLMEAELTQSGTDVDLSLARQEAVDQLLERFVVGYALPVLDALAQDPNSAAAHSVGLKAPSAALTRHRVWTAHPMLSAQNVDPDSVRDQASVARSVMAALEPFLEELPAEGLHTLEVRAKLGGGGAPGRCPILPQVMVPGGTVNAVPFEGGVFVDGQPSGDICELSGTVNWPLPPQGATLEWKQVMVLRGDGAPAGPAEEG